MRADQRCFLVADGRKSDENSFLSRSRVSISLTNVLWPCEILFHELRFLWFPFAVVLVQLKLAWDLQNNGFNMVQSKIYTENLWSHLFRSVFCWILLVPLRDQNIHIMCLYNLSIYRGALWYFMSFMMFYCKRCFMNLQECSWKGCRLDTPLRNLASQWC